MNEIIFYVRLDEQGYTIGVSKLYDNVPIYFLEQLYKTIKRDLKFIINERKKLLDESSDNNQHTGD